ncbi:MAG: ABC transporter permease [Caldicoprobacterales bacterium]|nr:ABC transporter permease [Clostridiales bacterium]
MMNSQATDKKPPVQGSAILRRIKRFLDDYSILYAVIILIAILSIASPDFLSLKNFTNVFRQISMVAILTVGMFFVMVGGGIDISCGATVGLTGVLFAMFMVNYGMHPVPAFIFTVIVGAAIGTINGTLVTRFGIPAMIATLGTQSIARGFTYVITGAYPISGIPDSVSFLGRGYVLGMEWLPWPVFIVTILALVAHFVAQRTQYGRSVYAVGGNTEAAYLSGIKDKQIQIITYIALGVLSAIAGMILTSRLASGQPNGGLTWEFEAITAAVIGGVSITGGRGKVFGALLGAVLIGLLTNGMTLIGMESYPQQMVKGMVLVLAIGFDIYSVNKKSKK